MLHGVLARGTTPTHDFELPYPQEFIKDARITYVQNREAVITKTLEECRFENNVLSIDLTQEETLLFMPNKIVNIETRVQIFDGRVVLSEEPIRLRVIDTINSEVFD